MFGPKMVYLPQTIFFWKNIINIMFILLLTTFIVQNFLKISHNGSRVMTISHFGSKMAHLPK